MKSATLTRFWLGHHAEFFGMLEERNLHTRFGQFLTSCWMLGMLENATLHDF